MRKIYKMTLVVLAVFGLSACDKVKSIAGGPADGHEKRWYMEHRTEAIAEANYCASTYQGPKSTPADAEKMPNYCKHAIEAKKSFDMAQESWIFCTANCEAEKVAKQKKLFFIPSCSCSGLADLEKDVDVNSKEVQDLLAKARAKWATELQNTKPSKY